MITAMQEVDKMVGVLPPDAITEGPSLPTPADNERAMAELEALMRNVQR